MRTSKVLSFKHRTVRTFDVQPPANDPCDWCLEEITAKEAPGKDAPEANAAREYALEDMTSTGMTALI